MDNSETINVQFTEKDLELILLYMKVSEATTIQNAILNAISVALDGVDFT